MVNVPYFKPHVRFLPHFVEWYAANKIKHDLHSNWQMYRALHHAQNEGLFLAKKLQCTHILWTEDDHFRFPVDGLEVLLDADLDVVGFSSYKKKYPYSPINFRKSDKRISLTSGKPNLQPFYQGDGPEVQPCDLIGWNFLLTKIEVFDKLKRDPFEKWAFSPTDSHFCQYCLDVGIQPHVHFGWVMVMYRRKKSCSTAECRNPSTHRKAAFPWMRCHRRVTKTSMNVSSKLTSLLLRLR